MQYGKLENGYIRYAPKTVTWQGHTVNNPDAEKLKELGYLPIRYVDMPTDAPEGKHYESGWEQTEDAIVQTWTLVEDEPVPEPPSTIEEQIAALQRALINQKIVGGGITNITDSSENRIKDIKLFGKSEQDSTEGYNLWNPESYNYQSGANMATLIEYNENTIIYKSDTGTYNQMSINTSFGKLKAGKYKISYSKLLCRLKSNGVIEDGKLSSVSIFKNGSRICSNLTFAVDDEEAEYTFACSGISAINGMVGLLEFSIQNPMLSLENQEFYEPYTGGQPSPRPDYPQPIRNVGKYNEETGKYEVDVIVSDGEESGRKQTVTLSLDQPLRRVDDYRDTVTKENIERKIKRITLNGSESWKMNNHEAIVDFIRFSVPLADVIKVPFTYPTGVTYGTCDILPFVKLNSNARGFTFYQTYFYITLDKEKITDVESLKEWLSENPLTVEYVLAESTTEPLPEDFKQALKNLSTYYPTTVISVGDGEMYGDVELTYIADTKNYIDQKFEQINKTLVNTQAKLL